LQDPQLTIQSLTLLLSITVFWFNLHRVRVRHETIHDRFFDVVSIDNDSSFSVRVSAIGHIDPNENIKWMDYIGDVRTNKNISYPMIVEGRSELLCSIIHNIHFFPTGKIYGYCVQLDSGRTYVSTGNLPFLLSTKLKFKSIVSRVTFGRFGFLKNRIYIQQY